jgi:O-antigen/teichoic acid export membrane protein
MITQDRNIIATRVISLLISFIIGVIITRFLSVNDRGIYTFFTSWLSIGTVVISGGLPVFLLKRAATKKVKNLFASILQLLFIYSACFLLIISYTKSEFFLIFFIVLISFLFSIVIVVRHYMISKGNLLLNEVYILVPNLVILCLFSLGYLLNFNLISKVYFWIILNFFISFFFVLYLLYKYRSRVLWVQSKKIYSNLFKLSYPFYLVSLMGIFQSKVPYIILSFSGDYQNLAFFGVAEIIPALFLSVASALINKSAFLIFTNNSNFKSKLINIILQIFIFFIILFIICFFGGNHIITSIYGSEYSRSSNLIPILLIVALFSVLNDLLFNLLINKNKVLYGLMPSFVWIAIMACLFLLKIHTTLIILASMQLFVVILMFLVYGLIILRLSKVS